MSFLSVDVDELRKRWMKLYLNLFMLKSRNPKVTEHLESFKETLALFNEKMMPFLDKLEELI
ncbi:hypothetical protein ES707_18744 [subsurface metagenome]